jgi:ATP-dependent DNA ligase
MSTFRKDEADRGEHRQAPRAAATAGLNLQSGPAVCQHIRMPVLLRARPATSGFIEPCLPTAARIPPSGPDWIHEIKHDGYRLMARLEGRGTRLFSRRGHDWSERFPRITEALASLTARSATIDGEAVVCCPKTGLSLFDRLHSGRFDREVILCGFDLLELKRPRSTHPAA